MAKTPRDARSDPMAREVDRLLAQLSRTAPQPDHNSDGLRPVGSRQSVPRRSQSAGVAATSARRSAVGLWSRVLLAALLGLALTQWPYPRECGWNLAGYLGAVTMVVVCGAWLGFASWRLRSGVVQLLAQVLFYWGVVLAAEQILPRVGYAAETASWRCERE